LCSVRNRLREWCFDHGRRVAGIPVAQRHGIPGVRRGWFSGRYAGGTGGSEARKACQQTAPGDGPLALLREVGSEGSHLGAQRFELL
jgi:hypothetical protein